MGIIVMLIIGGIVGWIAARLMGRDEGVLGSIVIGIVGAFIGGLLARLFGSDTGFLALSWSSFFWSLIGAIILVAILNAMSRPRTHTTV
jgi:uncharacterized membrane protein YeaQ/YmgE (transglycosylase-associated protein family)